MRGALAAALLVLGACGPRLHVESARLVPLGSYGARALDAYLVRGRPLLAAKGKGTPALFLNARGGPLTVTVELPARKRLAVERTAQLGTLVATRAGERGRTVPLARACGRYVDWYTTR